MCHAKPFQHSTLPGTNTLGQLFLPFLGKVSPSLEAKWKRDFGGKAAPSLEKLGWVSPKTGAAV